VEKAKLFGAEQFNTKLFDAELFDAELNDSIICGLDEAGRGPLAGPVYAAAVILPADFPVACLADSKKLSATARQAAFDIIVEKAWWGIDMADPHEIDTINILQASMLAMQRAYKRMILTLQDPDIAVLALVDGNRCPELPCACRAIVKGDAKVTSIMAASILAKVARDRAMMRYDWLFPEYGYAGHKGYPTAAHRECCRRLGPSPIQRHSFSYSKE